MGSSVSPRSVRSRPGDLTEGYVVSISRFKSFEETAASLERVAGSLRALHVTGDNLQITIEDAYDIQSKAVRFTLDLIGHLADGCTPTGKDAIGKIPIPFRGIASIRFRLFRELTDWHTTPIESKDLVSFWEWGVAPVIESHSPDAFSRSNPRKRSWPKSVYVPGTAAEEEAYFRQWAQQFSEYESIPLRKRERFTSQQAKKVRGWILAARKRTPGIDQTLSLKRPGTYVGEYDELTADGHAGRLIAMKATWAETCDELAKLIRETLESVPTAPEIKTLGRMNPLRTLAESWGASKQKKFIFAICDGDGTASLSSLATVCDWPENLRGRYDAMLVEVNRKLKKHNWEIRTLGGIATAKLLKERS